MDCSEYFDFLRLDFVSKCCIFQQYNAVPPTPLLTSDVLKEENEQWPDVQQGMSLALREMRVDQVITFRQNGSLSSTLL